MSNCLVCSKKLSKLQKKYCSSSCWGKDMKNKKLGFCNFDIQRKCSLINVKKNRLVDVGIFSKESHRKSVSTQKENKLGVFNSNIRKLGIDYQIKNKIGIHGMSHERRVELGKLSMKDRIMPYRDTSIEVKIQNFLKLLRIEFFTHVYMTIEHAYRCDIHIPSLNLIIECDGDYWHGYSVKYPNPSLNQRAQIDIDKLRTLELLDKGFRIIRLWEHEIKSMNIVEFENKIK